MVVVNEANSSISNVDDVDEAEEQRVVRHVLSFGRSICYLLQIG